MNCVPIRSVPAILNFCMSHFWKLSTGKSDIKNVRFLNFLMVFSSWELSKNLSILHILYLICLYSDLQHTFNTVRPKRFNKSLPDAYSKQGKKLFYAMGCIIHGCFKTDGDVCKPCNYLPIGTTLNDKNIYGEVYGVKKQRFDKMIAEISEKYIFWDWQRGIDVSMSIWKRPSRQR